MSTKNSKTPQSIFEQVKAFLKLGDDGKLQSFYIRLRKKIERDIKNLETSKAIAVSNFEATSDEFKDKIADAKEAVQAAWMNITPENVATNALQEEFMGSYMNGIKNAEHSVNLLEGNFKKQQENHDAVIKDIDEKIAAATAFINMIDGKVTESTDSAE